MSELAHIGFADPIRNAQAHGLRPITLVQLIATFTLALSTLVAATAVSIGFARAHAAGPVAAVEISAS
jgi:hypothetical protein